MDATLPHLARIRECFPDLVISTVEANAEGLVNDVLIINHEWVFRFPKDERARKSLVSEARILSLVRQHVNMRVPYVERRDDDFAAHRLIPGVPLHRDEVLGQSEHIQDGLADQLATFLRQLHDIPVRELEEQGIPVSDAARRHADWIRLYEGVEKELFPLMMAHVRDWVRRHFEPILENPMRMAHQPALVHGDLGPYHILYERTEQRINGVIDFGAGGLGDPAVDFACVLYFLGESVLRRMARFYPGIRDAIDRARFWAGTLELQWALAGVRSKDLSWLMCHVGSARDAKPIGSRLS